jgi:CDP-glycerol glycerophosphotransferase (TagB/SpsB family)
MNPKTLLFFAKSPMNYVLFEPVHRLLAGDARLAIHFTGKFQGARDPARVYEGFDLRGGELVRNAVARWRSWDIYVSPDYRLTGKRARLKVHMFHGFSLRNFAISERARDYDRLFVLGDYMKRRFVEAGVFPAGDPRLVDVGMPKLDPLVNGAYDRAEVLRGLGLDPARRTVLFAPTWIRGGCLDVQGEAIVRALGRLDVNTIVKLHDNSYDLRKARADFARTLPALFTRHQALARGFNSNPFLAAADVMVSDASSVANEFLVLDRPLVFFRLKGLERDYPSTDLEGWGNRTGAVIDRADELGTAVQDALAEPGRMSAIRRAAAADFFYAPGSAAERAASHLLRYAAEGNGRA